MNNESYVMTKDQKDCPYCHPPFKRWVGGFWDEALWQIDRFEIGNKLHYELLSQSYQSHEPTIQPTMINYCPKCGRNLRDTE